MMVSSNMERSVDLVVGQQWRIRVASADQPVLTVMLPDDTTLTPAVLFEADGTSDALERLWLAAFAPQEPGRYIAAVVSPSGGGALLLQAYVAEPTGNALMPNADTLDAWLGPGQHSFDEPELSEAMSIALAAQRRVCRVPVAYPADLREAAHRRAARYLFMRRQLTAQQRDDGDYDSPPTLPPGRDYETRALESPFRKLGVG